MNTLKQSHLNSIRSNSAYPAYRAVIGIISTLMMVIAVLIGLGGLVTGLGVMSQNGALGFLVLLIGLAFAALAFFFAQLWKEAAQILVDIGDSVIETSMHASTRAAGGEGQPF